MRNKSLEISSSDDEDESNKLLEEALRLGMPEKKYLKLFKGKVF